jgi:di-N-acetylchitobiase
MSYDEQSQIWDNPCSARAKSPFVKTMDGVKEYLKLGIDSSKLILGLPWYGYNYPCVSLDKQDVCEIKPIPFRGCNCSDAAGKEIPYSQIMELRQTWKAVSKWDGPSSSPFFNYEPTSGQMYQMRYDDPLSLSRKYAAAKSLHLGGVGMWTANFLNYNNATQVREMWSVMP